MNEKDNRGHDGKHESKSPAQKVQMFPECLSKSCNFRPAVQE